MALYDEDTLAIQEMFHGLTFSDELWMHGGPSWETTNWKT